MPPYPAGRAILNTHGTGDDLLQTIPAPLMTKKLPTAIHEMKGTDRSDQNRANEPRPPTGEPAMPPDLIAEEQEAWRYAVGILLPLGVLTVSDGLALESLACCIVEVRKLRQQLGGAETVSVTSTQKETVDRLNPLYPMYQQSRKELRALWSCFGLDPLSRTSVHTVQTARGKINGDTPAQPAESKPAAAYFKH